MAQLFTYNVYNHSIRPGLPLMVNRSNPVNPTHVLPPHLLCGEKFITTNRWWNNPPIQQEMLMAASLKRIEPEGQKPFWVLDQLKEDEDILLFIETELPRGFKSRLDVNAINAYSGVYGENFHIILNDRSSGSALLRCQEGATVQVFLPDGRVESLFIKNGRPQYVCQTQKQMAVLRIAQLKNQLADTDDVRRQHGIFGGAIRLLRLTKDPGAIDVLVDFFTDQVADLTDHMRKQVRYQLIALGHPAAGTFLDGWDSNVVSIESAEGAAKRAASRKKKQEKSAADRALREKMRGGHSKQKSANN